MGTFLDLQNRIASDLTRTDLTSQIASVIPDAISVYENETFWFNYTRSFTFLTVAGQKDYTSSDLAQIPLFVKISAMYLPQLQSIYPLDRYEPQDFEVIAGGLSGGGRPTTFTYVDNTIRLWPTPTAVYTLRVIGTYKFAPLVNPTDSNPWTTEAEQLIRTHSKMLMYLNVLKDVDGATRMQAQLDKLLSSLRFETSSRLTNGTIQGTQF